MVNWQRGVMRAMRIVNHPVTVTGVHDCTPWYRRITFVAPELVADLEVFPTLWLRLWVPHPAKGPGQVSQRAYTLLDVDRDAGTFALEFVLHETAGPAGDWAGRARIGEVLEAAVTPARPRLPEGTSQVLLAGDVTALPAINGWLESLPESVPVTVLMEDEHDDVASLPRTRRPGATWQWIAPEAVRGAALARTMTDLTRPEDGRYAWAAGEKTLVKLLRPVLRDHLGLDRAHHLTQFYWMEGKATG